MQIHASRFIDDRAYESLAWWIGIFYGLIALVLGWTLFASHLASLLTGSLPRLVSPAEFAGRFSHISLFFFLVALSALLLITVARYWFGEEMALAAAAAIFRLVIPAPVKLLWHRTRPIYRLSGEPDLLAYLGQVDGLPFSDLRSKS
jgi:hypothetical protein